MYPTKKLGEISKTTSGGTPLRSSSDFWGGNIPWLKSGELNDNLKISESEEFITDLGLKNSSAKLFEKGTLLIALYGATAGKLGILDIDATTNQAVCSIQNIYNQFLQKYLFYYLFSIREQIIKDSFGGAQPNISKGYLDNIQIPLPPLPIQKLIVQKLDSSFEKIDQSIELTKKNLQNIEELNKSVLEKVFSEGEYEIKKLGEISKTTSGGTPLRDKKEYWGGNIPWLKSGELNDNLKINSSEEFITEIGLKNSSAKTFKKGTLLIALYGATAGKLGILDFDSTTNQAVCSIQNLFNLFLEKYLFYFLLSKREQIIKDSFGGAQPNISKTYLDQIQIPLPPLEKQKEIVAYLDDIFEKNKALKESYEKKLKDLEEMKQTLLKEAFEGRLVKE